MGKRIFILIFLIILTSCYKKSNKVEITDFSKPIYDTLIPMEDSSLAPYTNAYLEIKGEVNDTIRIVFFGRDRKYSGVFEDEWNMDYYGEIDVTFEFDPYWASNGEVVVEYRIN